MITPGNKNIYASYGKKDVKISLGDELLYPLIPFTLEDGLKTTVFEWFVDFTAQNGRFRIPSIEITNNDVIICVTDVRRNTFGDFTIVDVGIKRSLDWGKTFLTGQIVHENNGIDTEGTGSRKNNGVILNDKNTGRVYLFCGVHDNYTNVSIGGSEISDLLWDCVYKYSDDDGATWSEEISVKHLLEPTGSNAFLPGTSNKGIVMKNGTLVVPIYEIRWSANTVESGTDWIGRSAFIYSSDHGITWQKSSLIPAPTNECSVIEHPDGVINVFARTYQNVRRHFYTTDMGATWQVGGLDKKNNAFACQIGTHKIGNTLIWHSSMGASARKNLQMFISKDYENFTLFIDGIMPDAYDGYSCSCSKGDKFFLIYERFDGTKLVDLSKYLKYI